MELVETKEKLLARYGGLQIHRENLVMQIQQVDKEMQSIKVLLAKEASNPPEQTDEKA